MGELVTTESEHGPVDRGHPFEGPVLGVPAEQAIELVGVLLDATHERNRILVGLDRQIVEQTVDVDVARLELVTESQCPFTGFTPRGHGTTATCALRRGSGTRRCECRP